ncbi:Transmembrane protein [Tolypocladium ophioglossoides CBS 100239]|uniref:Transmembrane protein n=1 Tax=Tolypocladium ophioglossoides (strain CBS 100239) TaxID=1163406 RepID=A0A0L0NEP1_TOLOC|nr:Transmembrane protein [Tolypocladium ophioglossoides CBS 100239]
MNLTCNSTLEEMRISPGSEIILIGPLNFHDLARIIAAACTLIAVVMSLFLIWMHALHYTQPREQRYIIRILFMVPVYAIAAFAQLQWYWHAIYFQVISDCYEAFAIASFFALLCHYVAPDLHTQKVFFREIRPVKPWVMPVNWFAKCCGGQRGPWRTPKSGLTWFNIIWIGIYHYCFIRVTMTISAVVAQYFERYCESSNSPVFGHIWIIVLNALAVTVAMFCLIQFYVQLREPLAEHKLFLKIIAIKLVIFLSFWQASAISVGTSTLNIVHANRVLAYPDLKVGIPALLLCVEMACFAIMHLWAFPYAPYMAGAPPSFYPVPGADKAAPPLENGRSPPSGGFMGLLAIFDALNLWDFVKAFGMGMRWLFCGVKRRKEDVSYKLNSGDALDMDNLPEGKEGPSTYDAMRPGPGGAGPAAHDRYGPPMQQFGHQDALYHAGGRAAGGIEESAALMDNAQPNPEANSFRRDYSSPYGQPPPHASQESHRPHGAQQQAYYDPYQGQSQGQTAAPGGRTNAQARMGEALWGPR